MKKILLSFSLLFVTVLMFSQREISGTVQDASGEPLIGANIIAKGTTVGTITDFDGAFSLTLPAGVDVLVASYTGFDSQDISVAGLSTVNISMVEGQVLDEIVVTALGVSREEKALGYAVQEVSSKTIQDANTVSAIDALAGSAAGVQITSSSGAAGASSRIVLRGQTSFNGNNEALIVIDGVRMNNDENSTERSLGGVANSNRAMDLNPNDIENVTVLKGAAATALYGIEGARGVVLITTKSGKSGELKVDVGLNTTISRVSNITGLQNNYIQGSGGNWNGPETGQSGSWGPHKDDVYWDGSDYKWDNNGRITTSPTRIDENGNEVNNTPFSPYNNVEDFFQTGQTNNMNVAVSGGVDNTNYRFSFGNSNETGITPNNEFNRYTLGLKVGSKLFDEKLSLGFGANYARSGGTKFSRVQIFRV